MSIQMDNECLLCLLKRHLQTADKLGDKQTAERFAKALLRLYADPITSWEIDGETVEIVSDFIFLGSKITADGDCSHEIKRHSLEGKL